MMLSLGLLLLSVAIIDATAGRIAPDPVRTRRVGMLNNLVRSALLFWPVIWTPLRKYVKKDQEYADSFSAVRLAPSITPAMLRYIYRDTLGLGYAWVLVFCFSLLWSCFLRSSALRMLSLCVCLEPP